MSDVLFLVGVAVGFFVLGWFYGWTTRGRSDDLQRTVEQIEMRGKTVEDG